jgi:hypothetical protein
MNDHLIQAEKRLIDTLQVTVRGPRRNGLFALWLFVHVCDDALPPDRLTGRAQKRRLDALERRLSSLSLPPSFRKALTASVRAVAEDRGEPVVAALTRLVDPAREALGKQAADAVVLAIRSANGAVREHRRAENE